MISASQAEAVDPLVSVKVLLVKIGLVVWSKMIRVCEVARA